MSVSMESVQKLLADAKQFADMTSARQGAFRARLTRYLNEVEDDRVRTILENLQERVGKAAPRATKKLTPEDLEEEFSEKFESYDTKRRAAFKAKATRLLNEAKDGGDDETAERLTVLQETIETLEREEEMENLLKLADDLDLM